MTADPAIPVLAALGHRLFLGLQLRVAVEAGREPLGRWMHLLFRRQHEAKFLSSFHKLGLEGLPHAVACARYHVLSNSIGGVAVEYMEESDRKAWVRFRYPRWIHDGPALAAVPVEAGRGFLTGWYAQNGVSLGNPRLGYVCVSEDVAGFGLCGYFIEEDRNLAPEERLRFAHGETPPAFDPAAQPRPPAAGWDAARLAKAERNYAFEYLRNGLPALAEVLGRDGMREIALPAARLTGLSSWRELMGAAGGTDGGPEDVARAMGHLLAGMGDEIAVDGSNVTQTGLRLARGVDGVDRADLVDLWTTLWEGFVHGYRQRMALATTVQDDTVRWRIAA